MNSALRPLGILLLALALLSSAACNRNARYYYNRAETKATSGDLDGAIADFDRAIARDPKYTDAYIERGIAKSRKADPDAAIADYSQAIALNPQDVTAYYNRGNARAKKDDLDGAIADFQKSIATGRLDYVEYQMAKAELKALGE